MTATTEFVYPARVGRPKVKANQFNFRLSPRHAYLLAQLEEQTGKTRTDLIERGIDAVADQEGVTVPADFDPAVVLESRAGYTTAASDPAASDPATTDPATRGGTGREADG